MLIDRDKAIEAIDEVRDLISVNAYCAITERLKMIPTAKGDLISRKDAINVMCRKVCGVDYCGCSTDCKEIKEMMELPSAERKGKWIKQHGYYDGDVYYECSECGEEFCFLDGCTPEDNLHFYCPNCGARMVSGE